MTIHQESLNDAFGIKEKKIDLIEETITTKTSFFDYLSDICAYKTGKVPEEKDFEMKGWNTFMILRYLSLEDNYVPIINILNEYQGILTPKQLYKILLLVIPKKKKFLKYPKLENKTYNEEDIQLLQQYFSCSKVEILDYFKFGFLSEYEISKIKEKFGGKE